MIHVLLSIQAIACNIGSHRCLLLLGRSFAFHSNSSSSTQVTSRKQKHFSVDKFSSVFVVESLSFLQRSERFYFNSRCGHSILNSISKSLDSLLIETILSSISISPRILCASWATCSWCRISTPSRWAYLNNPPEISYELLASKPITPRIVTK